MKGSKIIEGMKQVLVYTKYKAGQTQYGEDVRGMTCCSKGRIGDGHSCYLEAVFQQKRNDSNDEAGK